MSSITAAGVRDVRYEPEEQPPPALALGLGFQFAMLTVAGIVLTPAIVVRAAGGSEDFLSWAAFAALAISGVTTVLQAVRVGRIGSGHVLLMGTSAAFIAVCVTALIDGGPGLLATLVALSALFQFGLSTQLSLLRRVLTPTVCGTVIMLIPVTLMPIMFGMLADVPEGSPPAAAPATVAATLIVTVAVTLRATGVVRLWAPVIGIASGCVVAGAFGLYNTQLIAEASWIGLPAGGWPGFDLQFGVAFWSLLPAFIFVTLIGAIETIGDSVAIQRVSRRKPRATDYRVVQGAVTADGVGNLLSGLAATVPNTTYSSSVSVTDITGVASRTVGIYIGAIFLVLAFLPKFMGLILAIPSPVAGAYTIVIMSMLFVLGMRVVVEDGVDYRK
ncbi:MAG: xanthine/uracil/vitamin C permease, partial [Acidobacteria bacterium]|nr:xanthine/uracil/vitamin C permease [Acidobacteriota bacterium]